MLDCAAMLHGDRALTAFSRNQPERVLRFVRAHVLRTLAAATPLSPEDRRLAPAPLEADFVARVGDEILHIEWQGYRDAQFLERLFAYHLNLALRYPRSRIRSIAIWLVAPKPTQRGPTIEHQAITIEVKHVVLAEISASALIASGCAFLAPAGDLGLRSADEVCDDVVAALVQESHAEERLAVATVVAGTAGRYTAMKQAMERARVEPVIYLDLLEIGLDQGREQGLEQGREQGLEQGREQGRRQGAAEALRRGVLDLLEARGLADAATSARVNAESDAETLRRWLLLAADGQRPDAP